MLGTLGCSSSKMTMPQQSAATLREEPLRGFLEAGVSRLAFFVSKFVSFLSLSGWCFRQRRGRLVLFQKSLAVEFAQDKQLVPNKGPYLLAVFPHEFTLSFYCFTSIKVDVWSYSALRYNG